eukprot:TRINITY_DN949_c0_g1_i3.p2 TRINITY_DN949_c0_g1~~TRINITY_DN949_c0_g1_i3.p2  ORF type:complete len:144 (+),score=47.76 TRINITY_DN949_c0_g1_i3:301-732(+)
MSRYPSAHGHTPGYRSMTSSSSAYPSALDSRRVDMDLGLSGGLGGRSSSSLLGSNIDREFSSLSSTLSTDPLLRYNSPLATAGAGRAAESSYQAKSYSSTTTQSSADGGRPHISSHSDSTYKSVRTGPSSTPPHQLQPQHILL